MPEMRESEKVVGKSDDYEFPSDVVFSYPEKDRDPRLGKAKRLRRLHRISVDDFPEEDIAEWEKPAKLSIHHKGCSAAEERLLKQMGKEIKERSKQKKQMSKEEKRMRRDRLKAKAKSCGKSLTAYCNHKRFLAAYKARQKMQISERYWAARLRQMEECEESNLKKQDLKCAQGAIAFFNQKYGSDYRIVETLGSYCAIAYRTVYYHCNFRAMCGRCVDAPKLFFAESHNETSKKMVVDSCVMLDGLTPGTEIAKGCGRCPDEIKHPVGGFKVFQLREDPVYGDSY